MWKAYTESWFISEINRPMQASAQTKNNSKTIQKVPLFTFGN